MNSIISISGIDEAISNLNYMNKNSLKYRLIQTIRRQYSEEMPIDSIKGIESDVLIKDLWETMDNPDVIRNRRKNLNSIKSSINSDLKKLYKEGKNNEGIIIGMDNLFEMSDDAKNKILESFTHSTRGDNPIPIGQIMEVLKVVNEILAEPVDDDPDGTDKFDELKDLVKSISNSMGIGLADKHLSKTTGQTGNYESLRNDSVDDNTFIENNIEGKEPVESLEPNRTLEDLIEEPIDDEEPEVLDPEEEIEEVELDEEPEDEEILDEPVEDEGPEVLDPEEDLEEVELDEEPEDEEPEVLDPEEDLEEVELDGEPEEEERFEEPWGELELSFDELLEQYSDGGYEGEEGIKKAKLLAEEFNYALATMDRYYNQYLLIPKNYYIVGSANPGNGERPQERVRLEAFYFGKFPVTNALFEIFIEKTGYRTTAEKLGYGTVYNGRYQRFIDEETGLETFSWNSSLSSKIVKGACWYQPLGPGSTLHNKRSHPVVQVSKEDAIAFAAWTGKRLPTENEWEAASRTSKGYEYPWGKEFKPNQCNIEDSHMGGTSPVDQYKEYANDLGVADTLGNVLEWTQDSYESSKPGVENYILKGGSWVSERELKLSKRFRVSFETSNIVGFRCVAY